MDELSDHFEDITDETMSTEASVSSRLGEPKLVADAAITAYWRRSFLDRRPMVAFLVIPQVASSTPQRQRNALANQLPRV